MRERGRGLEQTGRTRRRPSALPDEGKVAALSDYIVGSTGGLTAEWTPTLLTQVSASAGRERPTEGWRTAPRLARVLVAVVFTGLVTVAVLHIFDTPLGARARTLSVVYVGLMLVLQLRFLRQRVAPVTSWLGGGALLVQAVVAYLPFVEFGQSWAGMPGFLAGSFLLALPGIVAWAAFAAVVASMAGIQAVLTGAPLDIAYTTISTVITGLLVYGLTRLAGLVEELHEARAEIAMLAVAEERLRVSRDLHDLLGYSISAIALKSELTARLVVANPERANREVCEIIDISRRVLADVRSVARGYREMSLEEEAQSARSILLAADIEPRMSISGSGDLPTEVATTLAIVMREGVTNVLRHSKARYCEITVERDAGAVQLTLVNDGARARSAASSDGGTGIDSMSARVAALGGSLRAEPSSGDRWRVVAVAPLVEVAATARA